MRAIGWDNKWQFSFKNNRKKNKLNSNVEIDRVQSSFKSISITIDRQSSPKIWEFVCKRRVCWERHNDVQNWPPPSNTSVCCCCRTSPSDRPSHPWLIGLVGWWKLIRKLDWIKWNWDKKNFCRNKYAYLTCVLVESFTGGAHVHFRYVDPTLESIATKSVGNNFERSLKQDGRGHALVGSTTPARYPSRTSDHTFVAQHLRIIRKTNGRNAFVELNLCRLGQYSINNRMKWNWLQNYFLLQF